MKNKMFLVLVLLVALVFRFILTPLTFHQDILSQANWGQFVSQTGSLNFYNHNVWIFSWPNHPPLTSLYYGFCHKLYLGISLRLNQSLLVLNKIGVNGGGYYQFVESFDKLVSPEIPFKLGFLISLKIFPIIFDIFIGLLIFHLLKNNKKSFIYLLIYLISPFSWYLSSLWGQTDQISFLFAILSFIFITKVPVISIILFFLSASIKPTSLLFLMPLFLFILIKSKINYKKILLGGIICIIINFLIFSFFSKGNLFYFTFKVLLPRIFDRPARLTTNSYNFWHMFALDRGLSDKTLFLKIPANYWSAIIFIFINIISFKNLKKINTRSILESVFIVSFGGWLFLTNMLDRYLFIGIVSGLMVSIYYPKLIKYWLMLSLIYWLNLFRGWWYPNNFGVIKYLLTGNNYVAGFFLALGNFLIYLRMVWVIYKKDD